MLGALAEIKKKMRRLESRRDALEADLRSERSARSEAEAQSEKLKTEVNNVRETIVVAKETETAYRARAAALLARKDARIARLESDSADASRATGDEASSKETVKETVRRDERSSTAETETVVDTNDATEDRLKMVHLEMKRTRRELTKTKAAWRDAELV